MRFPSTAHDLFAFAFIVVAPVVAGVVLLWPASVARRRRRVEKWAGQKLVALTPDVAGALDRALAGQARLNGAILLVIGVSGLPVALIENGLDSSWAVWSWTVLATAGLASFVVGNRQLARPWFTVGPTRSARPRAVGLTDYVFTPLRWRAWVFGLVCLGGAVLVVWTAGSTTEAVAAVPAIGVAASVAAAEWIGRRIASRPQPAGDAAELYALDAWRADITSSGFHGLAFSCVYVLGFLSRYVASSDTGMILLAAAFGLVLLLALTRNDGAYSLTWTRHRLWPELPDGETLTTEEVKL